VIRTQKQADAAVAAGRHWLGFLRRQGPSMAAGFWADLSYAAGIPVANYYASAPLESATLLGRDGIDIGPAPEAGMSKYLGRVLILPPTATGILQFKVHDICLYYPFIDGDGGFQEMVNSVPMPRYGGVGTRMMAVSQGSGLSTVDVRVTYTNSDGVPGRQVTTTFTLSAPPGTLASNVSSVVSTPNPSSPYLPLQGGDRGVRSIESVEPLAAGGGIFALVIVKPLLALGMHQATAAPVEVDCRLDRSFRQPDIEPGAHIAMIALGTLTATPATIQAEIETIWG
jgi:hypothetical protein